MAKILVVDDDAANLKLAALLLEQAGYAVLQAPAAGEGLRLAREHAPELVLLDVQMPGTDGFAALRALRADAATARTKVAALTALAMRGDRERLLSAGFDGYFSKPIRYKEFLAGVAALLEGGKT